MLGNLLAVLGLIPFELSLYINFELIWPWVNTIFAALWVAFAVPLGIKFGFGLLKKIFNAISAALGG
mgnify:CR=1 FL=1